MTDLAILYEHPRWFAPLFAALDRRGIAHDPIDAAALVTDPADPTPPARVVFNRIAMSSILRSPDHPIYHGLAALDAWAGQGARVLNGAAALSIDASKARQLALIARLGLAAPATRIVHRAADVVAAAAGLRFPIVVKANVGGSGAGIVRYDDADALAAAVADASVPRSIDGVLLVQEHVPARGGTIRRVETLAGRFLYAIDVAGGGAFDLCPADACQAPGGGAIRMTRADPSPETIAAVEAIVAAAGIDVGGVELMVDDRDGATMFYDINALSNFVADPLDVLGWDPHERLVDWLESVIGDVRA